MLGSCPSPWEPWDSLLFCQLGIELPCFLLRLSQCSPLPPAPSVLSFIHPTHERLLDPWRAPLSSSSCQGRRLEVSNFGPSLGSYTTLWIFPQVENKNELLFLLESACIGCYFPLVDSCRLHPDSQLLYLLIFGCAGSSMLCLDFLL